MEHKRIPGITVFTPTYNRAHTLRRLYESLLAQRGEFEWLVVDDGSVDGTAALVETFRQEKKIPIRYVYKENGGKHTALNVGICQAEREYFLCLDSDDCLAEDAIAVLEQYFQQTCADGLIAYKSAMGSEERIGPAFPQGVERCTLYDLINVHVCSGDRTLVYRTEILEQNLIPEPKGVKFFPETYLYDRFDEHHICYLLPRVICRCEYQQKGYSASFRMLMIRNALAMKWFFARRIDMPSTFGVRMGNLYRYVGYALLEPGKTGKYHGKYRYLLPLAFPKGLVMYMVYGYYRFRDKKKRSKE